jgi:amidohydrolase
MQTVDLVALRRTLHGHPEVSGREALTAQRMRELAERHRPDALVTDLGGHGLAVVFEGGAPGPTILIRCELDALPIPETDKGDHTSQDLGTAHLCGHDGHLAIVAGLLPLLHARRPARGRVVLLFQPAEETGEGAARVLADARFAEIVPDLVFALHNLPGFPEGSVLLRPDVFAAASTGMIVRLLGKTSHAAEPEKGINPALAVSELVPALLSLPREPLPGSSDLTLCTIVGIRVGQAAFGTSAGDGEVLATLRALRDDDLATLRQRATTLVDQIARKHRLAAEVRFAEPFPATVNHPDALARVAQAARQHDVPVQTLALPFRWSEDFGHFTARFPGALFGLGAGETHPPLHHPAYDFPDRILATGVKLFESIIREALG